MIEIIGAPFDLCGMRLGSRLGPAAIRLAGLEASLHDLNLNVLDTGDVPAGIQWTASGGMRNFPPLLETVVALKERVGKALEQDRFPVVLGGEHALVMGSISAALQHYGDDFAMIWIDAHADINTPGSSETGNIHGMPVAALLGMASDASGAVDSEWKTLLHALGPVRLKKGQTAWYGLRDVDHSERKRLDGLPLTMHEIDRYGVEATVGEIDLFLRRIGARNVWISFDVDALDPILAPGTGTAVRGGLTYREAHLCAELLHEQFTKEACPYRMVGVDVVETNPLYDTMNSTAIMAVEWVSSLFGKTIL